MGMSRDVKVGPEPHDLEATLEQAAFQQGPEPPYVAVAFICLSLLKRFI